MKILVTYLSQTGNTKSIAKAIYSVILEDKVIQPLERVNNLEGYDLAFIGFPIHQSEPANIAKNFIEKHAKGKKIALFCTHAMPPEMHMLGGVLDNVKKAAAESELLGLFNCQGELSEQIANVLIKSGNPQMEKFGEMRSQTVGHPDESEIANAKAFANEILRKIY
ncbi:MAG: flavodoxin family protein [Promethearchaeota archaeon]